MPLLALLSALALAQVDSPAKASGYLGLRAGWTDGFDANPPPLADLYGVSERSLLTEANLQARVRLAEGYEIASDLSFFVNSQSDAEGRLGSAPSMGNRFEPNELYGNLGFCEHANGLIGRKRLVFGSGFAHNPSDLLNPPKDPTDPSLQRAGAWMVRAEAPFERFTLTALWAPKVTATEMGLPRRFLAEPGGSGVEQLFGARLYALVLGTDLNLIWFFSNRYADSLPHSHRLAASFSRYFFTDYELHAEAIVQRGSDRVVLRPDCLPGTDGSPEPLLVCRQQGERAVSQPDFDAKALFPKLIVGTRTTFSDDSTLSLEYDYDATGLSAQQFDDRQRFLRALPDATAAAAGWPPSLRGELPDPRVALGSSQDSGAPAHFVFAPQRRHYLFVVFQKPKIRDDFAVTATAIVGLEALSALFSPAVAWSAREWLTVSASGYVPVGPSDSEFGSLPFRFRAILEAKAFF